MISARRPLARTTAIAASAVGAVLLVPATTSPVSAAPVAAVDGAGPAAARTASTKPIERVTLRSADRRLRALESTQLRAVVHYADGTRRDVTRVARYFVRSTGTGQAAVADDTGVLRARRAGVVAVQVQWLGRRSAPVRVRIDRSDVRDLGPIIPEYPTTAVGERNELSVRARLGNGEEVLLSNRVEWSSSDPSVLRVGEAGVALALSSGTATITARLGSRTSSIELSVVEQPTR